MFPEQRQDLGEVRGARGICGGLVERVAPFEGSTERYSASVERQVGDPAWSWRLESQGLGQQGRDKGKGK